MSNSQAKPPGAFPATRWTAVLAAADSAQPDSAEALESLCQAYWYPLYVFARREGLTADGAQDAVQEFFSKLLARNYLQSATPTRGRFRSFLLASFKHMLANERRDAARQKRGGGAQLLSLDETDAEDRYLLEPLDSTSPDLLYERRWAQTLLARVLDRLSVEYSGHVMQFDDLKRFLIEPKGAAAFAEVAAKLKVSESALKSVVHRMRKRYAELFRDEVSNTVQDPGEVTDEIRHMFEILAG